MCYIIFFVLVRTRKIHIYGPLAHLVEHLTLNQGVRGSSPRRPTHKSIGFADKAAGSVFFLYKCNCRMFVVSFKGEKMRYEKLIATEDTTQMYEAWADYRNQLTCLVYECVDNYYRKSYLSRAGKLRDDEFCLDKELEIAGQRPVIAIWGAGNCSDLDLRQLSRIAKLVLIDRELERTKRARDRYGLSETECQCIDLGFWEVYEEEERFFADLLEHGADDAHLAQYLSSLERTMVMQKEDMKGIEKLFDFSVVAGLASQLNARFAALLHIYGRNVKTMPFVTDSLNQMNESAAYQLYKMIRLTTRNACFCCNELLAGGADKEAEFLEMVKNRSEIYEEAFTNGGNCNVSERCTVAGSREFLRVIEEGNRIEEIKMMHRAGLIWPFTTEKHYFMDVLMFEIINKKNKY